MIGASLTYLKSQVNSFAFPYKTEIKPGADPAAVVFPAGNQAKSILFEPGKINMLLVALEQERVQGAQDVYSQRSLPEERDQLFRKKPSLKLSVHVLFVACFADYATAWNALSSVMLGFQMHPVFSPEHNQDFPEKMGMITTDLISQSMTEQRDLWATLGTCLQPAVLYRFRLLILEPSEEQPISRIDEEKIKITLEPKLERKR
jgi:hypothetical protein